MWLGVGEYDPYAVYVDYSAIVKSIDFNYEFGLTSIRLSLPENAMFD